MKHQTDHDDELERQNAIELVLEDQGLQKKLRCVVWKTSD